MILACALSCATWFSVPGAARAAGADPSPAPPLVFPNDPAAVIDAKRDLGAKGDGVSDDTAALQKGLDDSCGPNAGQTKVLFLPNGTYRVTRSLVVNGFIGPWLYGASRDGVTIRLADGSRGVTAVLRTHPRDQGSPQGKAPADWYMRNVRHLTIDAGNNPDADGVRFYSARSGILQDIRVRGNGKVGVNTGFLDPLEQGGPQGGPNLVQDLEVEGFETGVLSQGSRGQTLSRVTVRDCRKVGLAVAANAVGVEDLTVTDTPLAVDVRGPNNGTNGGAQGAGAVALLGGRFLGGDFNGPAIHNEGIFYARVVKTSGFKRVIESATPGGSVNKTNLDEYTSHPARSLFGDPKDGSLKLPIQREPAVAWEADPTKWVCANDFGATPGDNKDDTVAIQKAIDAAASAGKTVVYFRGVGGASPNWYTLDGEVRVHGSVRFLLGLGWGRVMAGPEGRLIVEDDPTPGAAAVVKFQNIDSFGGRPPAVENRSASRTVVIESCGVHVVGAGGGDIFATDCPATAELRKAGQKMWAREFNAEGRSNAGLVHNAGGELWTLGVSSGGAGVKFNTTAGGKTDVLGMFLYGPGNKESDRGPTFATFAVEDAAFSVAGLREVNVAGVPWTVKVRERRQGETREMDLDKAQDGGGNGWSLFTTGAPK